MRKERKTKQKREKEKRNVREGPPRNFENVRASEEF